MELISPPAQTPEEVERMLNELRVRYFDLYDKAPVGHCTLSEQGVIQEANLSATTLLGTARRALGKQPLSRFIYNDDQDISDLHRKQFSETDALEESSP